LYDCTVICICIWFVEWYMMYKFWVLGMMLLTYKYWLIWYCGEIEFGMFWASVMTIGFHRLDSNAIIMQNQVLQNYADWLVEWVLAERIQSQGGYWLRSRQSSIYSLSESKVKELTDFVVVGREHTRWTNGL